MKGFLTLASLIIFCNLTFSPGAKAVTITAANCSQQAVQDAINSADPEDTVQVPAGSCAWSSTLTINKGINLIGTGIGSTVITGTSQPLISYAPSSSNVVHNYAFRVSGFTFDLSGSGQAIQLLSGNSMTLQTKIRIHNNRFYNSNAGGGGVENLGMRGVIDSNIFDTFSSPLRAWGDMGSGQFWWDNFPVINYGSSENMYIEDNTFINLGGYMLSDSDTGGRYAFRYNTVTANSEMYPFLDIHGGRGSGSNALWGAFGAEVYGNQMNGYGFLISHRGGKALVFYNNLRDGGIIHVYDNDGCPPSPHYNEQLIHDTYYFNNRAGISGSIINADIAVDNCGYIAKDSSFWNDASPFTGASGVGCGTLASRTATCTTGVGYWATNQDCTNLLGMVGANPTNPISGTLYKCTSPNTWTAYYTLYTYPHPLRLESIQICSSQGYYCCPSGSTCSSPQSGSGCSGTCCASQDACAPPSQYFQPEVNVEAESGTLSGMQIGISGQDTHIYTNTDNQGSASYTFQIQSPGKYRMEARVNSNNDGGQNSFYVGLDSEPAQGNAYYTYDTPIIKGFAWDNVSIRGGGSIEIDPMVWDLSQGLHTFWFYGRESNTWLDQIILRRACQKADSDCNSCVSFTELTAFISRWYVSNEDVTMTELMQAIGLWKAGGC